MTILTETERMVRVLEVARVTSRTPCSLTDLDRRPIVAIQWRRHRNAEFRFDQPGSDDATGPRLPISLSAKAVGSSWPHRPQSNLLWPKHRSGNSRPLGQSTTTSTRVNGWRAAATRPMLRPRRASPPTGLSWLTTPPTRRQRRHLVGSLVSAADPVRICDAVRGRTDDGCRTPAPNHDRRHFVAAPDRHGGVTSPEPRLTASVAGRVPYCWRRVSPASILATRWMCCRRVAAGCDRRRSSRRGPRGRVRHCPPSCRMVTPRVATHPICHLPTVPRCCRRDDPETRSNVTSMSSSTSTTTTSCVPTPLLIVGGSSPCGPRSLSATPNCPSR